MALVSATPAGRRAAARRRTAALSAAVALWLVTVVSAQTSGTGSIRGRIVDDAGQPLAAATVEAANFSTGLKRSAQTDADGRFTLSELPVAGSYRIEVTKDGFAPKERSLELRAGEAVTVDGVLRPLGVRSDITVYGSTEGVRSDSAQLGNRLDAAKIAETPVLGNKLTNLPLLDSAVRSARGTGDLFLNNTLFVIDGGGRRQTTYSIDGATGDDAWGRQTILTNLPLATVQEFTVITSNASAEFGRTTGGAINVITRQGTNRSHGELVAVYRPASLQPDAPITGLDAGDELWQGSGYWGGPIAKDKLHLLVGAEYNRQDRDSEITSPLARGIYTGEYRQKLVMVRGDAELSAGQHLVGRLNLDSFTDTNPADAVGGVTLPSAAREFRREVYTALVSDTAILGSDRFNELRASAAFADPITEFEPVHESTQFVRPGVSTEGESRSAHLTNDQYALAETFSWIRGRHSLRFGGDFLHSKSGGDGQEFGSPFVLGQFTFKTGIPASTPTSALTINDVQRFTQGFGDVSYSVDDTLWSLFAQDDFELRPNLRLNLGLRYDRQELTDDDSMISPRLGFAWNPGGSTRTVVRGGWGLYYSQIRANIVAGWELGGPEGFFNFSAAPGQLGFPTSLAPIAGFPPGAVLPPRDITVRPGQAGFYSRFFDVSKLHDYPDELLNPRTRLATLGVERELGENWFLSLDGVSSRTDRIDRNLDENAPAPFERSAPGQTRSGAAADATRPIQPVANGYRRILVTVNEGRAAYDALQVNLRRSFGTRGGLLASYTWSHSRNNVEADAPGGDPNEFSRLDEEWADSLLDQRHRAVVSGWWTLPAKIVAGGVFQVASARPFNPTTGADNNGDGGNTDRPVVDGHVVGRNSERGTSTYDLSLFVERDFALGGATLQLRAEAFNVTNHDNIVGRNGTYGNAANGTPLPTFGAALGGINNVEPARQYQFQVGLRF